MFVLDIKEAVVIEMATSGEAPLRLMEYPRIKPRLTVLCASATGSHMVTHKEREIEPRVL